MYHPLPTPTPEQKQRSAELSAHIERQILKAPNHVISFSDYMELALYMPELGYYMTDHPIFGKEGDFITAPELSPFFARCIAKPCMQVLEATNGDILEIGAGSGKLAADLLRALPELPQNYYILEISPALQQRQQHYLQQEIPTLYSRVKWINKLPKNFSGIIIANEVIDALPTDCFEIAENQILNRGVTKRHQEFVWANYPAAAELTEAVQQLQTTLPYPMLPGYYSEISLRMPEWLKDLANILQSGVILLLDYGFAQNEFYHPERSQGTLMCHFRQHAQDNPFWYPGLQDITVHVNFSAVAEAAVQNNLEVIGFTSQANFLLACGLLDILQQDIAQGKSEFTYAMKQQIQWLTSPAEMGELFKVMALAKHCDVSVLGFQDFSRSY